MSSNPNGFKERTKQILRKKKTLVREIENAWNRKVSKSSAGSWIWPILSSLVVDLSQDLAEDLRLSLERVIANQDFAGYISLGGVWRDPQKYGSPRSYLSAQTLLNLFRKYPGRVSELDPMKTAINRFYDAEMRCRVTNKRLIHYRAFDFAGGRPLFNDLPVHQIFHLVRRKISSWLGPINLEEIFQNVRHGPGGCVGVKRPWSTPYYKFNASSYTCTTGAYWLGVRSIAGSDAWVRAISQKLGHPTGNVPCIPTETRIRFADTQLTIAEENEVTFVPKDATTHRAIAIEPMMNVMVQLAVGKCLKERLQRAGCDLKDQTRNQELAKSGSVEEGIYCPATLDLEMASDTCALELVRELFPPDWFDLLDCLRSRFGRLPEGKGTIEWAKFSSMGNGFTFELESMIFYAFAQAVSDLTGTTDWFADTFGPNFRYGQVSVFGDDIIVPGSCVNMLRRVLRFAGFRVNERKSFSTGPFRESCGSDYFNGQSVRPFFFKRTGSQVYDFLHLHNGLKWLKTNELSLVSVRTLEICSSLIPDVLRHHLLSTDPTLGDGYIWVEPDEAHRSALVSWDIDQQSWITPCMRPKTQLYKGNAVMRYLQFLYVNTGAGITESEDALRFPLALHKSNGGSGGDVVQSGRPQGFMTLDGGNTAILAP